MSYYLVTMLLWGVMQSLFPFPKILVAMVFLGGGVILCEGGEGLVSKPLHSQNQSFSLNIDSVC